MSGRGVDPFLVQYYDGLDSPAEFERVYAVTAAMQDWDDDKTLRNLPLFLRGKAKRVYDALATKTTIKHIFDELKLKCAVPRDQLVERFQSRRRHAGESIARYADELFTLLSEAMPGLDAEVQSTLLKTQLCAGVPDNVRTLVNFNRALSWDDLVAALDRSFPTPGSESEQAESNWMSTSRGRGQNYHYYGGKRDTSDSRSPSLSEHNNTLASLYDQWENQEQFSQSKAVDESFFQSQRNVHQDQSRHANGNFIAAKSHSRSSNYTEYPGFNIDSNVVEAIAIPSSAPEPS